MNVFKWTDELATKDQQIDADHKLIIEKAEELNNALLTGKGTDYVIETVEFLNGYVKKHFEEEEKLQVRSGYPDVLMHKQQHRNFEKQLDQLTEEIKSNPKSTINTVKLNRLISGWFFNHIRKLDQNVAVYTRDK